MEQEKTTQTAPYVPETDRLTELVQAHKLRELRETYQDFQEVDIAEWLGTLPQDEALVAFRTLPKEWAAEVFSYLDPDKQEELITGVTDSEMGAIVEELYIDDAVDMLEELPANVVKRILRIASPETRSLINQFLKYPENSAGSVMTAEYTHLKASMTVPEAIEHIRRTGADSETIYTCYVTDQKRYLEGVITVRELLLAKDDQSVGDVMDTNVISVNTLCDREEAAKLLSHYGFLALPVVDEEKRLVGIITVDDALTVIEEETTEDIEKMAAILPSDKSYMRLSVFELWRNRIPWLLLLMVSATFTGMILTTFENALAAQVALVAFIPMLMDTGGNSGAQASVTVIRGLSLGEIEFSDILRVIWKELRVAGLCGLCLGAASFAKAMLIDRLILGNAGVTVLVALTVALTMTLTVMTAKAVGCTLPLIAKRLGFDPAVMASPLITTIVDALSLLLYFAVASRLLGL